MVQAQDAAEQIQEVGEQLVRFTYRIQLDGDYINNCAQEILAQP